MSLVIPGGFCNVTVTFACDSNTKSQSTAVAFFLGSGSTADVLETFAPSWHSNMEGSALSEHYTVTRYTVETASQVSEQVVAEVGTGSFSPSPPNVSAIMKKVTLNRGRSQRGRLYLPGGYVPESATDAGGNIDPALVTSLDNNFNAVISDMYIAGFNPVLLHSEGVSGEPTPITQFNAEPMVATQRRRLR